MKYRFRGLGLFLCVLIAGGCQSSGNPSSVARPAGSENKTPSDDGHWSVDGKPSTEQQLMAQRTAEYAQRQQAEIGPTPVLPQPEQSPDAPVSNHRTPGKREVTIPLDDGEVTTSVTPPVVAPRESSQAAPVHRMPVEQPLASGNTDTKTAGTNSTGAVGTGNTNNNAQTTPDDPNLKARVASLKQAAETMGDGPRIQDPSTDFAKPKPAPSSAMDPLEFRLAKRVRDNPRDIAAQLDIELLAMLKDEPSPELENPTTLPHADREMINTLIDGLSEFRSDVREDETMLQAKKIRPLLEMAERLRAEADLAIPTVALCRRVEGFGKYEAFNPARFPAGRESKVIVYCEVENFQSRKISTDWWETRLTQQVTLYTDNGQYVWSDKPREISDQSHRRRNDFYAYELLRLPPDLTIGRYLLKVTMTDENAGKVAEETVPVSIGATEASADR